MFFVYSTTGYFLFVNSLYEKAQATNYSVKTTSSKVPLSLISVLLRISGDVAAGGNSGGGEAVRLSRPMRRLTQHKRVKEINITHLKSTQWDSLG